MKNTGLRMVVLIVFHALWLPPSYAADRGSTGFNQEHSKQESIFHSSGEQVPGGYTLDRSLADYTYALCSGFSRALAILGPKDRWLDIGAGKGQAILDYYNPGYEQMPLEGRERLGGKAQAVAISIEDRRTPLWEKNAASLGAKQLKYFFNKYFREYSLEELGQFQVITDVIGGFSYTNDLSIFMEKALGFLELNGSFYTLLQDVRAEDGKNSPHYPNAPFLTEMANADGSQAGVCSWLKSITCVEVSCEVKPSWKPPLEAYRIRKICEKVTVPALVPLNYQAGTPPQRRFQFKN